MTGYDLLKEVRASPEFSNTPFIMITAESKTENVIAAKKAGVNNYIVKPFNAATLKTKMEAVFPGRRLTASWTAGGEVSPDIHRGACRVPARSARLAVLLRLRIFTDG